MIERWAEEFVQTSGCLIMPKFILSHVNLAFRFVSMDLPMPSSTTKSASFETPASLEDTYNVLPVIQRNSENENYLRKML